jgi:hypothetical protein
MQERSLSERSREGEGRRVYRRWSTENDYSKRSWRFSISRSGSKKKSAVVPTVDEETESLREAELEGHSAKKPPCVIISESNNPAQNMPDLPKRSGKGVTLNNMGTNKLFLRRRQSA